MSFRSMSKQEMREAAAKYVADMKDAMAVTVLNSVVEQINRLGPIGSITCDLTVTIPHIFFMTFDQEDRPSPSENFDEWNWG